MSDPIQEARELLAKVLDRCREALEDVSPGPWTFIDCDGYDSDDNEVACGFPDTGKMIDMGDYYTMRAPDAHFCTTARELLPQLLDVAQVLAEERDAALQEVARLRALIMGAVYDDPERVRNAMDSSAGIVAEAIQCLDYWEALGEVREAAQALVTQELLRRKGLRGGLKRADWAHLIDRLGRCRAEAEETNAEAFLASIPPKEARSARPTYARHKPLTLLDSDNGDDEPECGLCGGEVDEYGICLAALAGECEPGANTQSRWQRIPGGKRALHP